MKEAHGWQWPDGERHMLDWIADPKNRVVLNGRPAYQGKKQLALRDACPTSRRRTLIDVGGHVGLWSFNFAQWFNHVEAFEPVREHRECFKVNVLDAGCDNVQLWPFALGERAGHVSIYSNPISSGDSWVRPSSASPSALAGHERIEMRTIDSFNFPDVDAIKIDCEGYEEFVLRGAVDTIATWRPVICVEQKRDMAAKFGLKPLGAINFLVGELNYKTVKEISGDFIMVPR